MTSDSDGLTDLTAKANWYRNGLFLNVLSLAIIFALNPLVYLYQYSYVGLLPDSALYIAASTDLWQDGHLFVRGWGHVDSGTILPPVYPFLIGLFTQFLGDRILSAEVVSTAMMLGSSLFLFFFTSSMYGRFLGVVAVLVIQLNYFYLHFGTLGLTEASFVFFLSAGLWWLRRALIRPSVTLTTLVVLGLLAALVFLTRQIGLTFFLVAGLLVCLRLWGLRAGLRPTFIASCFYCLGFAMLVVPYSAVLYSQTGQMPLTQSFRIGEYVVQSAPSELGPMASQSGAADEAASGVSEGSGNEAGELAAKRDYMDVIAKRRRERALNSDSSEMLGMLVNPLSEKPTLLARLSSQSPLSVVERAAHNVAYVATPLGLFLAGLLAVLVLTSMLSRFDDAKWSRCALPTFLISYVIALSFLTDLVERYVHILFGFGLIVIVEELYRLANSSFRSMADPKPRFVAVLAITGLVLALTPGLFTKGEPAAKIGQGAFKQLPCVQMLGPNEPVFAFHPAPILVIGAVQRMLPNDSLEKVAKYAERTGVRWFITFGGATMASEMALYENSPWLDALDDPTANDELLRLRCVDAGGRIKLYEFPGSSDAKP